MNISVDRLLLRISALLLLNMGESRSDVSRYLGVSRVTLVDWSRRFREGGWGGLLREHRGRRATRDTDGRTEQRSKPIAKSTMRRKR
jgi:transposase